MLRHIVPSRESRPLTPPPEALLFEKLFQILLRGGDGSNAEILYEVVQHIGRNKRRQRGAKANILDSQIQQRQQNAHCILLIPRKNHGQRQIVHAAAERLRQGQRDFDSSVSVVALAHVHESRQAANGPEVKVVEAVFSAGQCQHHGIGGRLLDKLSISQPSTQTERAVVPLSSLIDGKFG